MKLKTVDIDGKTYAEVQDGKPVFEDSDGKTIAFDAPGTIQTISARNAEAKANRERAEAAEKALKQFEGIENPADALKAIETMKSLDQKKLIDAGEVDRVKAEISKAYDEKLTAAEKRALAAETNLNKEMIGGSFARSKFIADKIAVPSDLIQSQFGSLFTLEDGKIVAKRPDGNPVYSKANPGNPANFDEALEILIDEYPHKDHILKGTGNSGGGSKNSNGGVGMKTMTTEQFNTLDAKAKAAKMAEPGFSLVD